VVVEDIPVAYPGHPASQPWAVSGSYSYLVRVTAEGIEVHEAVEYAVVPGFRPLLLDLYVPPAAAPPVILYVHGGGWRRGTRRSFGPAFEEWSPSPFERLASAGFAVASVDYRLSGEALFPAQLEDLAAAMAWLRGTTSSGVNAGRANAGRANAGRVNAGRVVLWGESAGAHLAALLALTDGEGVRGVVDWYGPSDLTTLAEQVPADSPVDPFSAESREALLLGAPPMKIADVAWRASPCAHVHAEAPPFGIWHGTRDRFVPFEQSVKLANALREAGATVHLHEVDGADHMWRDAADVEGIFNDSLAFAREVASP
jgi:acetyl esterase/lipase